MNFVLTFNLVSFVHTRITVGVWNQEDAERLGKWERLQSGERCFFGSYGEICLLRSAITGVRSKGVLNIGQLVPFFAPCTEGQFQYVSRCPSLALSLAYNSHTLSAFFHRVFMKTYLLPRAQRTNLLPRWKSEKKRIIQKTADHLRTADFLTSVKLK